MKSIIILLSILYTPVLANNSTLVVYDTPQHVRPYIIPKGYGLKQGMGDTINLYPVTGNSSGGAFCLMITNGPSSGSSGVFPHVHKRTHENFYSSKGRTQLWSKSLNGFLQNQTEQQTRVLFQGDIGSVPPDTVHTFQLVDPDTSLAGVLVPGGFEELFFALAQNPSLLTNPNTLASYDVYPQTNFTARQDAVNGIGGTGNWYDGPNALPASSTPYFIAKNYGPKYLNSEFGLYQIVTPLVTSAQSNNQFTQGTITMSPKTVNQTIPSVRSEQPVSFLMEEGMLEVELGGETARLIEGDVLFVPGNTTFRYTAVARYTKFMYVCAGNNGIDAMLLKNSMAWNSSFYPDTVVASLGFRRL
jgi:quercetin dioxygenase-like cupin family protein